MKMTRRQSTTARRVCAFAGVLVLAVFGVAQSATADASSNHTASGNSVKTFAGLTPTQQANLMGIARDTWKFFADDVDPTTHLPMDNLSYAGGSATPTSTGQYTGASNIGVYLWSVVSAEDLGLVSRSTAQSLISATLTEVSHLDRSNGFLYQWYDTTNGKVLLNPGQGDCPSVGNTFDNCSFLSNVDNGWYASGLIVVRQAMPELASQADALLNEMNFGIFYDDRAETHCNVNPAIPGNQPTGQMYGGYYVGSPPGRRRQLDALLPQRRDLQRSADLGVHRHGSAPDAWQRVVAELARVAAAGTVRRLCHDRPGLLLARSVADGRAVEDHHRPGITPKVPGLGGALHVPELEPHVHADVGRRDVRGADGK